MFLPPILLFLITSLLPPRYGYFGRETPEVVHLMFCRVSGCLTEGRIFLSASGEEMVSINSRDTMGIRMLQREDVEVRAAAKRTSSPRDGLWWLPVAHPLLAFVFHFFLHQVVLLTSDEDPVTQSLADKLAQRTNCLVIQVGKEPLEDLSPVVEKRKLQWNDVAYMGNMHVITQSPTVHRYTGIHFVLFNAAYSCVL